MSGREIVIVRQERHGYPDGVYVGMERCSEAEKAAGNFEMKAVTRPYATKAALRAAIADGTAFVR